MGSIEYSPFYLCELRDSNKQLVGIIRRDGGMDDKVSRLSMLLAKQRGERR